MSDKNYPEDGFNDLLSALASKPNKPQWLNTFVRTLQSRDVTLETWNSLINVIADVASDTISISDFLQILYKNCVWSVKGSANLEEKIGNVVLELSDFGINIDVSRINRSVHCHSNRIYDKDENLIKLTNDNLSENSVDTANIRDKSITKAKLDDSLTNEIDGKVSKVTPGTMPKVYTMMPDGVEMGFPATFNKDATTFVYRDVYGRAKFADPSDMYDASNKNYVDTVAATKLNRKTSPSGISVYAENPNGEAMISVSSNGFPYTSMFRDVNGRSKVSDPDPNSATDIANVKFVKEQVAGIVNSAPETLDTLQELSKALGDDPNFATTVTTELGKKAVKTEVDAALATKLDKSNVVQTTGQSDTAVMSQKATTDEINALKSDITNQDERIAKLEKGGVTGADGKSAYQIAVDNGFTGTETEWVASLHAANPKVLPMSQYATEAEAIAYMDSQTDHSIIYVWNNKVYCCASKTVIQLTGACLYGYRNSASSGIVTAAGKSMYVIPVSAFTAPLHVEDYKYPISSTPYIYGGTVIPTFNVDLIQQDAWVGKTDAFDISVAQLQGCAYVVFAVTTESQPSEVSVTVNGTVVPLSVITSPSQISEVVGTGTTTVDGYVDSGVIYTAIISSSSTEKYVNDRNSYILPVSSGYCESHATYEAGENFLTKYPYATMTEMFSALATANSAYITETTLGKDQSNTYDIKSYVLDAQTSLKSGQTSAVVLEKPTFIITSGLHGLEPDAVHTVYHFMQDLAENFFESEQLQYLHDNIKFVIIPICNPWGYVNQNYHNSRDVDLNKNFECGYRTNGTANTGTAANSEAETLLMKQVFDAYPKAIFHLECHGKYGVDNAFNKTIWFSLMQTLHSELIELNANKLNSQIGKRLYKLGYSTNKSTGGYITYYGLNGRPKDYTGTKYGILSGTMEGTGCIYTDTGYSVNTQKINCEALENFVLNVIDSLNRKVKVRNTDNEDTIASLDWYNGEVM